MKPWIFNAGVYAEAHFETSATTTVEREEDFPASPSVCNHDVSHKHPNKPLELKQLIRSPDPPLEPDHNLRHQHRADPRPLPNLPHVERIHDPFEKKNSSQSPHSRAAYRMHVPSQDLQSPISSILIPTHPSTQLTIPTSPASSPSP